MVRRILIRIAVIAVVLALLIVACGPTPAPEVIKEVVEETVVVEKEVVVTQEVEVEKEVITFMSWAEDDFEVWALQELGDRFEATHPEMQVDLIFVR